MKNSQIIPSLNALQELSDAAKSGPIRRSFAVSRTIKTLKDRLEELNEAQKKIVTEGAKKDVETGEIVYGKDADGNVNPNQMMQADPIKTQARIQELYDVELDDFKVTPFKLADLEKDKVQLSGVSLAALDWLIIDDEAK